MLICLFDRTLRTLDKHIECQKMKSELVTAKSLSWCNSKLQTHINYLAKTEPELEMFLVCLLGLEKVCVCHQHSLPA